MVLQHGIDYALHLVTNHFGDLVAKVCECLLRRGPLTLPNIIRYTDLNHTRVKNSLLVLIQHNCVQAFIMEEPDAPKMNTQYMALFGNTLHRVRFSKFLTIVSQEFDKPCAILLEGLLQHGRLSLKQMLDRVNADQKEGNGVSLDVVQENLQKLVMARYVERCPTPEPVLRLPTEEEAPTRKRGAKFAKIIAESEPTLEQRVLAAAVPMEALRFSFVLNPELNVDGEKNDNSSPNEHVGEKRKHDALESDVDGVVDEQIVLWRANYEEFIRRLRHMACIENVRARLDDGATIVFSAMVEASRSEEKKLHVANSVPLSVNSIYEEVIQSEKGRNMTFDHVRAALAQLSSPPTFVRAVDDSYSVDFRHIIEVAQSDEVESVVLKRFGRDAYRMLRLLLKAGRLLETDKISDAVFVEKKETLNILYKLWQDDYLLVEKLVAGTTQFLLWKVNKQNLWEHVLNEMFHAALNLSLRMAHEWDQRNEELQKDKLEKYKKLRFLLESSQMKLDDAIMLFNDF